MKLKKYANNEIITKEMEDIVSYIVKILIKDNFSDAKSIRKSLGKIRSFSEYKDVVNYFILPQYEIERLNLTKLDEKILYHLYKESKTNENVKRKEQIFTRQVDLHNTLHVRKTRLLDALKKLKKEKLIIQKKDKSGSRGKPAYILKLNEGYILKNLGSDFLIGIEISQNIKEE